MADFCLSTTSVVGRLLPVMATQSAGQIQCKGLVKSNAMGG